MTKQLIGSGFLLCSALIAGCIDDLDASDETSGITPYTATRADESAIWSGGRIPYVISAGFTAAQTSDIRAAMDTWSNSTPYRFVSQSNATAYVVISPTSSLDCHHDGAPGKRSGAQTVKYGQNCSKRGLLQDFGHVIGLWNEQQRDDAHSFLKIYPFSAFSEYHDDFVSYAALGEDGRSVYPFDFDSIMLSDPKANAMHPPTMTRYDGSPLTVRQSGVSDLDIAGATNLLTFTNGTTLYRFVNYKTSLCLDLKSTSRSRNMQLVVHQCGTYISDKWYLYNSSFVSNLLINNYSGQCASIPGAATSNGTQAVQFPCRATTEQGISLHNVGGLNFQMVMDHDNRCLGVDAQLSVVQSDCHAASNDDQQWTLQAVPN